MCLLIVQKSGLKEHQATELRKGCNRKDKRVLEVYGACFVFLWGTVSFLIGCLDFIIFKSLS